MFSLQRDLIRNRPTEIEFVNGEIVRLAKENGMEACYNEEVVQAVRELEASDAVEFLTRDEAVRRFRRLADS